MIERIKLMSEYRYNLSEMIIVTENTDWRPGKLKVKAIYLKKEVEK